MFRRDRCPHPTDMIKTDCPKIKAIPVPLDDASIIPCKLFAALINAGTLRGGRTLCARQQPEGDSVSTRYCTNQTFAGTQCAPLWEFAHP